MIRHGRSTLDLVVRTVHTLVNGLNSGSDSGDLVVPIEHSIIGSMIHHLDIDNGLNSGTSSLGSIDLVIHHLDSSIDLVVRSTSMIHHLDIDSTSCIVSNLDNHLGLLPKVFVGTRSAAPLGHCTGGRCHLVGRFVRISTLPAQ
jgi:hypothetical protein